GQHGRLVDAVLGEHPFPRPVWAQDVAVLTCSGEHFALGDAVNLQMPHPRSAPAPGRYSGRAGGRRDDEALAAYEPRRRRHLPRIASGNYPLPDGPLKPLLGCSPLDGLQLARGFFTPPPTLHCSPVLQSAPSSRRIGLTTNDDNTIGAAVSPFGAAGDHHGPPTDSHKAKLGGGNGAHPTMRRDPHKAARLQSLADKIITAGMAIDDANLETAAVKFSAADAGLRGRPWNHFAAEI